MGIMMAGMFAYLLSSRLSGRPLAMLIMKQIEEGHISFVRGLGFNQVA